MYGLYYSFFNLPATIAGSKNSNLYAQDPLLFDNYWFVHSARDSNISNFVWDNNTVLFQELRFELTFHSDKIVVEGCCGGVFEMDINYVNNTELEILNLTEIETTLCDESYVSGFYNAIKGTFTSFVGQTIIFSIENEPLEPSGIKYIIFNDPNSTSFVSNYNTPMNLGGLPIYWGHELPNHQWSLTHVNYEGQTMELPYGAALTVANVFEGTFSITLCGEIFVALNSNEFLDVYFEGFCVISCDILENTPLACEPITGIDEAYLHQFKQNAFNFLNDNLDQTTMFYEFTFGANSNTNARKLIIYDFVGNKLTFHSNENILSSPENNLLPEIVIYPNPVTEILTLETQNCTNCIAKLYNTTGKLLKTNNLNLSQNTINVKGFKTGLYFIVVADEYGNKQTQKFVKK